jgi:hypothetical protein
MSRIDGRYSGPAREVKINSELVQRQSTVALQSTATLISGPDPTKAAKRVLERQA